MNDTTELHQAEVSNLKQDLASMEEKIEYREEERLRELQDALENAQTRVSRLELQCDFHAQKMSSGCFRYPSLNIHSWVKQLLSVKKLCENVWLY